MPVATLTFNLPEEAEEHQIALDAWRYKSALYDMDQYLRSLSKHGSEKDLKEFNPIAAKEKLWQICEDNDIRSLT